MEMLSRCGYRCDLCLAYRPDVEACPSNQKTLSDGWFTCWSFRMPPERIVCDGCMAQDGRLIDKECPVRPCVADRGYTNCSACGD